MKKIIIPSLTLTGLILFSNSVFSQEQSFTEALASGKAYGDLRLRYESVEQDNALDDASAITFRTRLGYKTAEYKKFSAQLEFEDSRIAFGQDDFSVPPTGFKTGKYSIIADPETTEVDQALLQYQLDILTVKLGRQVIKLDDQRFVGDVGWRQDRQTFDALNIDAKPVTNLAIKYAYVTKRNRIFAELQDIKSKDHLLHASYQLAVGKLTAFAYLLENDDNTVNGLDTFGFSFTGDTNIGGENKLLYKIAYADQDNSAANKKANYYAIEGGIKSFGITAKLGYEVLGSDEGSYGFATPLATLHKFNGWSDQFLVTPEQGLVDVNISVAGKIASGKWGKWVLAYHDFSADESSATVKDLGSELNLLYALKFGKNFNTGIKFAKYSAGDIKVDTDKVWVWMGLSF